MGKGYRKRSFRVLGYFDLRCYFVFVVRSLVLLGINSFFGRLGFVNI